MVVRFHHHSSFSTQPTRGHHARHLLVRHDDAGRGAEQASGGGSANEHLHVGVEEAEVPPCEGHCVAAVVCERTLHCGEERDRGNNDTKTNKTRQAAATNDDTPGPTGGVIRRRCGCADGAEAAALRTAAHSTANDKKGNKGQRRGGYMRPIKPTTHV